MKPSVPRTAANAGMGEAASCADGIFGLAGRSGGSGQLHRWDFRAGRQNGGVTRGGGRGRISDPLGGEEKYFPPGGGVTRGGGRARISDPRGRQEKYFPQGWQRSHVHGGSSPTLTGEFALSEFHIVFAEVSISSERMEMLQKSSRETHFEAPATQIEISWKFGRKSK